MRRPVASGKRVRSARKIRDARVEIDAIDRAIVRQLARRARVVAQISRIRGAARRDPKREREVVRNAVRLHRRTARESGVGYPDRAVGEVFRVLLEAGGAVQAEATSGRSRRPRRAGEGRGRASPKRRRKQKES
ncbi:MAG: chorismate mutase [Acidobacteriota bacterium]